MAADQGLPKAQYNLGLMYFEGLGVQRDNVQAYFWFDLAASRFPVSEGGERNTALTSRDRAAKLISPAQIAEANKLASEWKPKSESKKSRSRFR